MGIGASKGQGSEATYEKRDVKIVSADKSNWPELAGAKLAESNGKGRSTYITQLYVAYLITYFCVIVRNRKSPASVSFCVFKTAVCEICEVSNGNILADIQRKSGVACWWSLCETAAEG